MSLLKKMWVKLGPLYEHLERLNYYQILGVNPKDPTERISAAYQRIAMLLHPDRHQQHQQEPIAQKIYVLFKRMTEAYQVLIDPLKRRDYDAQLKRGNLRYDFSSAKFMEAEDLDQACRTPEGRELVEMGLMLEEQGDLSGARMNYQMALGYEPDNQRLLLEIEKLTEKLQ